MLEEECGRDLRDLAHDLIILGFLLLCFSFGFELVLFAGGRGVSNVVAGTVDGF